MAHYLSDATVGELVALREGGAGLREISRLLGISKNTVSKYMGSAARVCPCGRPAGHKEWCTHRLQNSERRRAYLARRPVPPAPTARSRVREAVAEKRVWLGLEPYVGPRLPNDERMGAVGEITRLTAKLKNDVREDVRHEMIVSCFEGRCRRCDLERSIPTFWGFVTRGFVWREDAKPYDVSNIFYAGNREEAA